VSQRARPCPRGSKAAGGAAAHRSGPRVAPRRTRYTICVWSQGNRPVCSERAVARPRFPSPGVSVDDCQLAYYPDGINCSRAAFGKGGETILGCGSPFPPYLQASFNAYPPEFQANDYYDCRAMEMHVGPSICPSLRPANSHRPQQWANVSLSFSSTMVASYNEGSAHRGLLNRSQFTE
jgi:hypothetical protein